MLTETTGTRDIAAHATILRSPLLAAAGFAHAFSTRLGGVSAAPFDTLNFGRVLGDVRAEDVALDAALRP